jgi:hypothetical protein
LLQVINLLVSFVLYNFSEEAIIALCFLNSKGHALKLMSDGNQPISELVWLDSRLDKCDCLLLTIHPPNHFILWNSLTGTKQWKVSYDEALLGLDLDPFSCRRLMLRSHNSILLIDDFHPEKGPRSPGKRFYFLGGKAGSPGRAGTPGPASGEQSAVGLPPTKTKSTKGAKLTKIMRQMVLGENRQGGGSAGAEQLSQTECVSAKYHRQVTVLEQKLGRS